MSGTSAVWGSPSQASPPLVDASFTSVKMLMNGGYPAGTAGFNSDTSGNGYVITPNSNTVRGDTFSPFQDGYFASQFDGSSRYYGPAASGSIIDSYGASGSFTIECWVYSPAFNVGQQALFSTVIPGIGGYWRTWGISNTTTEVFYGTKSSSTITYVGLSQTMPINTWFHFALVGTNGGTNLTWYINGIQAATATDNTTYAAGSSSYQLCVGANSGTGTFPLRAKVSNLRFVSATNSSGAVYTSAFTPPTSPLTAIAGTKVLVAQSNTFYDRALGTPLTLVGTSPVSSSAGLFSMPTTLGSLYLNGTTDNLSTPSSAPIQLGTSDFTIEFWMYRNDAGASNTDYAVVSNISSNNNNSWYFTIYNNTMRMNSWSTGWITTSATTIAQNTWYHIAVTRSGTSLKMYINGVLDVSTTNSTNFSTTNTLSFGYNTLAGSYFKGYVSNLRIVKGSVVYSAAFTPPTQPLGVVPNTSLLAFQTALPPNNNIFIDNSPLNNPITVTGSPYQGSVSPYSQTSWSGSFTGSTCYLEFASNAAFAYGTGDFTVEGWFNSGTDWSTTAASLAAGDSTGGCVIYINGGNLRIAPQSGGSSIVGSVSTLAINTWYHIAITRKSGQIRAYANGLPLGSATSNTDNFGTTLYRIGGGTDGSFKGFISNVRAVKGSAVYDPASATITVPTFTLQPITNTVLLTATSSQFNDLSTNNFTPTLVGSPVVRSQSPFAEQSMTGSVYFDGSSVISAPTGSATLGSGSFSISCWVNVSSASTAQTFAGNGVTNDTEWQLALTSSGTVRFGGGSTSSFITSSSSITANTWNYIAVVRNGTAMTMYLNGVSVGTASNSTNFSSTTGITIGRTTSATAPTTGYISDLRVTPAAVLYSAAFTPPNRPVSSTYQTTCLISSTPGAIIDVTRNTNVRLVGSSARINNAVRKFNSASISFVSVSSSYARFITPSTMALGAGDFTLELWFYPTSNAGYLIDFSINSTNGTAPQIYYNGGWSWWVNTGDRIVGTTATLNTWNHLAVVRSSGTTKMYINGTQTGSNYTDSTTYTVNTFGYLGASAAGPNGNYSGYIESVRITPGVARYTANFTTPATIFPNQ